MTTGGGIEEDFIKCLAPTFVDEFDYSGADSRKSGMNRIGNLIAPNDGYCMFEDWLRPILQYMHKQQHENVCFVIKLCAPQTFLRINILYLKW